MTPRQLLKQFGMTGPHNQAKAIRDAAHAIGYTAQAVHVWVKKGRIPPRAQVIIKAILGG